MILWCGEEGLFFGPDFEDPGVYPKAWTVPLRAALAADTELMETVCNEDADTRQDHWVGKLADDQKAQVKVAPEILANYVGVYKGPYIQGPRTVEVTFSGGTLFVSVDGGPKQPIFPQSETSFSGTGLTYRFVRDDRGIPTSVLEGRVSGEYASARQK